MKSYGSVAVFSLLLGCGGAMAAGYGAAQDPDGGMQDGMSAGAPGAAAMDDPSGLEADTSLMARFNRIDVDGDGMISQEEAAGSPALVDAWSQVDANEDGQMDFSEFSAFETTEGLSEEPMEGVTDPAPDQPGVVDDASTPGQYLEPGADTME